jgi:MFS family permease
LFSSKPLLLLAAALAIFNLGNGAMLPLYALAVVGAKQANPAAFVAATVVIAQITMVFASLLAVRLVQRHGGWMVLLVSFIVLPIRSVIAPHLVVSWGVVPMQILDGITSGLHTVAVPVLVAKILNGTGRINVGQGAVLSAQGIGAALSPAVGGWIAQVFGYNAAFYSLGGFAMLAILVWTTLAPRYKPLRSIAAHQQARGRSSRAMPARATP